VDVMLRADAFPEPTFIWWDVRLQPRFGTIEVRIADAQTRVAEVAGLAALIQSLVRLEATEGWVSEELVAAQEVIEENRFLAARDGIEARLINVRIDERVPAREQLELLLAACAPHAEALGCAAELEEARALAAAPGARRQREAVRQVGQRQLVAALAGAFLDPGPAGTAALAAAGGGEA
jgi:carboxylate-amine ligase